MRKTAEPFDDVVMFARVVHVLGEVVAPGIAGLGRERPELLDGSALEIEVLGVLKRHVQEDTLDRIEGAVLPGFDAGDTVGGSLRVVHERGRRSAMDVARHLIEEDHEGQPPVRRLGPVARRGPGRREPATWKHSSRRPPGSTWLPRRRR